MTGRLIEADALIDDIEHHLWDWETVDGITATAVLKQTISDIKNQPTVEAIPVKWLKEQIELASSNGEDDYANAIDWTVMKWQTEVEDGQTD